MVKIFSISALLFGSALAYAQVSPSNPDNRSIPDWRVEWALRQLAMREQQAPPTTRPIMAAVTPSLGSTPTRVLALTPLRK